MALILPATAARPSDSPEPHDAAQHLSTGATIGLRLPAGARIAVTHGRLWLTEPGDADDHFVAAGQQHVVRRAGRVVLEGDSAVPARFRITAR